MKEYSILVKQGTGKAYIHSTYKDYFEAVASLQIIADYEDECHRMYYVDNDFFNNKYSYITDNLKYMCLQVREVSAWEKYSIKSIGKNSNDNIIFYNFRK